MEDLIIMVLQFLVEFIFDVLLNVPFDLIFDDWPWSSRKSLPVGDRAPEPKGNSIAGTCFLWWMGGCALAWVSLQFMGHTLIPLSSLRIANLFLAPVSSAYLSEMLAKRRSRRDSKVAPRNHFWRAFWFTLGYVLVRFAYAKRL